MKVFLRVLMVLVGFFSASAVFAWSIDIGGASFGGETTSTPGHDNATGKSPLCQFIDGPTAATAELGGDRQYEYVFRKPGEPLVVVKVLLRISGSSAYTNAVSWVSVAEIARPTMEMLTESGYRLIGNRCEGISPSSVVTIMVQ